MTTGPSDASAEIVGQRTASTNHRTRIPFGGGKQRQSSLLPRNYAQSPISDGGDRLGTPVRSEFGSAFFQKPMPPGSSPAADLGQTLMAALN
jgi:hypothetical protein